MTAAGGKPDGELKDFTASWWAIPGFWVLLLPAWVQLLGCSSAPKPLPPNPPPLPPVVMLTLIGSADQNPDINGAPSSVAVRIIQLTDSSRFERADAYAFMDNEQQTLGPDEAASQDVFLGPSEHRSIRIDPKPGVTATGVAVLYRDIDNAHWRAVAPIASNGTTNLSAMVGRLTVTLQLTP